MEAMYWLGCGGIFLASKNPQPGFIGIFYRMGVKESPRYTADVVGDTETALRDLHEAIDGHAVDSDSLELKMSTEEKSFRQAPPHGTFIAHFSQWKNLKVLVGTAGAWFCLDVGFYGTKCVSLSSLIRFLPVSTLPLFLK